MIKGSEIRKPDYPVDRLFVDRWSPRAMSGAEIPVKEIMVLIEAARWAPSSYNNQPWRILFARRETRYWPQFLDLLNSSNRVWAEHAGVLLVFVSKTTLDHDGTDSITHSFDAGAAWENFALQGYLNGYVVHGMQGFDYERARCELGIPDGFRVEMMAAVGKPGDPGSLPDHLHKKEMPNMRKRLDEIACEGSFSW